MMPTLNLLEPHTLTRIQVRETQDHHHLQMEEVVVAAVAAVAVAAAVAAAAAAVSESVVADVSIAGALFVKREQMSRKEWHCIG